MPAHRENTARADLGLQRMHVPHFHFIFQAMIFAALLESGTGAVHAINERIANIWRSKHGSEIEPKAPRNRCSQPADRLHVHRAALRSCRVDSERVLRTRLCFDRDLCAAAAHGRHLPVDATVRRSRGVPMKKLLPMFLIAAMPAVAAPPTDFDARVEALRRSIGVPGRDDNVVERKFRWFL